ncbi:MFS transporter [Actinomycetospora sp. TBRC 11914]|uniref:MFS transporter n=1 Tax=Actinomycetospora sp. TBRC 11914 TaxID=2729387 RepID=UPI00145D1BBC|nr:MFS transporter [Actinomycetospora sp. TBRC 11914]NMO88234.1 MHS family MFS transporter [Actinomycetospora sp. TBRC 11914]
MDRRRAFVASLSGTSLEYYDFAVYGTASALVLPQLFFPGNDPVTGLLLAFTTFAVGYVSRPLGGFVFGRLGDTVGRKRVLVITLLLIGVATVLIGLLPTYRTIGVAAPIVLVLLRFAQGVGVGGEWGSAVLLSGEFGDPRRRGFWSSAAQIGPPAGNLLANGVFAVLAAALTADQLLSWGWRVAFLLSAVLVAFGLWIRLRLEDTPVFRALQAAGSTPAHPIVEVLRTQPRALLAVVLSRLGPDVAYSLLTVYVLTYATRTAGFSRAQVLSAVLIGSALQLGLVPAFGALSDRWNRRALSVVAVLGGGVWVFVLFPTISSRTFALLVLGVVVGLVLHAAAYGPQAAFITEQFSPRLRATGSSLGYTVAGVVGGAIAPLLLTQFQASFGWVAAASYVAVACVLSAVGLALGRNHDPREDEELAAAMAGEPSPSPTPTAEAGDQEATRPTGTSVGPDRP